jgi:hypothetical protein
VITSEKFPQIEQAGKVLSAGVGAGVVVALAQDARTTTRIA